MSPTRQTYVVNALGDERRRLDLLTAGDLEVRATFTLSYEGCDGELRRAFRLLGLLETPSFAAWTLARLADIEPAQAEELVERLVDAELLEISAVADGHRYQFHDLLRVYAREQLLAGVDPTGPPRSRRAGQRAGTQSGTPAKPSTVIVGSAQNPVRSDRKRTKPVIMAAAMDHAQGPPAPRATARPAPDTDRPGGSPRHPAASSFSTSWAVLRRTAAHEQQFGDRHRALPRALPARMGRPRSQSCARRYRGA